MSQRPWHVRSQETVGQETEHHDNDRKANDTAGRFQYHDNPNKANHRIHRRHGTGTENELLVIDEDIDWRNHGNYRQNHINGMEPSFLYPGLLRRTEEENKADAKGQVDTPLDHGIQGTKEACVNLEQGEADADNGHDLSTNAFILDSIRLLIQGLQLFLHFIAQVSICRCRISGRSTFFL